MQIRKEYELIAAKCMEKYPELEMLKNYPCRIAFLGSSKEKKSKKRIIFADCTKVSKRYAWCCEYDFFITVYEPNCVTFTEQQMETLIRHELMHIGVELDDNNEPKYSLQDHSVQDFIEIIQELGINWQDPGEMPGQMKIQDLK